MQRFDHLISEMLFGVMALVAVLAPWLFGAKEPWFFWAFMSLLFGAGLLCSLRLLLSPQLGVHRLNVDTRIDNLASVRLMEKLGFRAEGVRRECIRNPDGTYQSWGLFGLLEEEYRRREG